MTAGEGDSERLPGAAEEGQEGNAHRRSVSIRMSDLERSEGDRSYFCVFLGLGNSLASRPFKARSSR